MTATTADDMDGLVDMLASSVVESFTVGIDADGMHHHYYRSADAIVVYDPDAGRVERYQPLEGRPVAKWAAYVDDRRGWRKPGQLAGMGIREDRRLKEGDA